VPSAGYHDMTNDAIAGRMTAVTPEEIDTLIASNVRALRARRRERQEDLAGELGWSRPTVGALEAGTRRVTVADASLYAWRSRLTCGNYSAELTRKPFKR
jgi:DNA-binding XRE family transcriptional regulator